MDPVEMDWAFSWACVAETAHEAISGFIESSRDPVRRISRFFNRSCESKQTMAPKKSNLLAYVEMPVVPVSNS